MSDTVFTSRYSHRRADGWCDKSHSCAWCENWMAAQGGCGRCHARVRLLGTYALELFFRLRGLTGAASSVPSLGGGRAAESAVSSRSMTAAQTGALMSCSSRTGRV